MADSVRRMQPRLPDKLKLADCIVEGGIEAWLREHVTAGQSWLSMSQELLLTTSGEVRASGPTLQRWADLLGIEAAA